MTERVEKKLRSASRWKPVAFVVGVFVLGGVCGVGVTRAMMFREVHAVMDGPPSEARAHFRLAAMQRHLDLTDDQSAKIDVILRDSESEREKLAAPCRPGFDELRSRTDGRIRDVLRPDQRDAYDKFANKLGNRFGHGRDGGAPAEASASRPD